MFNGALAAIFFSAAGPAVAVEPSFDVALAHSVEVCSHHVGSGSEPDFPVEVYLDLPASFARDGVMSAADVPALIHRFAATTQSGRMGWQGDFIGVPSGKGSVWVVASSTMPLCDVAVTGLPQAAEPPQALVSQLLADGWSLVAQQGTDGAAPLWRIVLQRSASGGDETQIVRLIVQGIRVGSSPDGIQMEMSAVVGRLRAS